VGEFDADLALFGGYLAHVEASTQYKTWRRDNCGKGAGGTPSAPAAGSDVALWDAFRAKVLAGASPVPPDLKTEIGDSFVGAGRMGMSISRLVGMMAPIPPPPPPPGGGVLRGNFTDFFTQWGYSGSTPNGQIFMNRWKTANLQTLAATQTPWIATGGAAIYEVLDPSGRKGFRFVCDPEMSDGSGNKKVEIYESNGAGGSVNPNGQAMIRGLGFTDEIAFRVRFPLAGNPSGFPGPNEGVFDRRNVFWQHSMDPSDLNYFGISRLGFTNRFFCSIGRHIGTNTELAAATLAWEVATDVEYLFRYIIKWRSDATGTFQWWVKRPTDPNEVLCLDYAGQTWFAIPNTEFGFYSAPSLNNEVVISDIRVTQH
jgi:hypothetical protein